MGKKPGLTIGLVGLWFPKIFIGKNHWLRENLQETMVFTNKYMGLRSPVNLLVNQSNKLGSWFG